MFRDLLSSRLTKVCVAFFVIIITGSLLYSWYTVRTTEKEMAQHDRFLKGIQEKATHPAETAKDPTGNEIPGLLDTSTADRNTPMSADTETLPKDPQTLDMRDAFLPEDTRTEGASAEEVPVSPYGFGPYPELPEGWPDNTFPAASADHELQKRVRIKLIGQGINVVGTSMEKGLVYPIIKGTTYVQWKSYWRPTGRVTYISRIIGHPDDHIRLEAIRAEKGRNFTAADVPSDIKLVSFEEGAIDPSDFLELPNR